MYISKRFSTITASVAVLSVLAVLIASCGFRLGDDIRIPEGFRGWVTIRYNEPGTPKLQIVNRHRLIAVPISGHVLTSSRRAVGYGRDLYSIGAARQSMPIKTDLEGCGDRDVCVRQIEQYSSPHVETIFFVGAKDEVKRYERPVVH
jgi:hypothetical protein